MSDERPDYFGEAASEADAVLRRIKGNTRRSMIAQTLLRGEPIESVPEAWTAHDLSSYLKNFLQAQHPQARGGEDLPDLLDGEVEIARVTLVDSVHGEVTSLRARLGRSDDGSAGGAGIALRLVDEWETDFALPLMQVDRALTAEELLDLLASTDPSPLESSCQLRLDSPFYPELDLLADRLGAKKVEANK